MRNGAKAKVAHLTSVHAPSDQRITFKECRTLAAAGYDVVLIAAGDLPEVPSGVRFRRIPKPRNRRERLTQTMWRVYRAALEEKADVYHFHDPELMFIGIALRLRGARVVFDVHEDVPADILDKEWIPRPLRRPISAAAAVALRALNRAYSAVVTATPAIARRFPHQRIVVVCNYPRIEEFPQRTAGGFGGRPQNALYLGSITALRCVDQIVGAFSHPEMGEGIRLTLAGQFEDEALEARVRRMPGWARTDYLGWRPRSEVPAILNGARVGLLLFLPAQNHEEAMPTKLFEYMAAGLPVIISSSLRCSSVLAEAECGVIVDPFDQGAIARAITHLVTHPAMAQSMGERARRLIDERFQWATEADKLTNLYAEIL
jgi:glycosyltransferase involved in cell wall biosynthesis